MLTTAGTTITVTAAASTVKNRFINGDGSVTGANGRGIGVSVDDAASGDALGVQIDGIALIEVGTDIAANDIVASDGSGKAKPAGANPVNGIALEAGAAGTLVRIKVI